MTMGRENKPHIGIFGRRNNGKSSIINCLSGQEIAIVSDQAGTTTDPVKKSYEIIGFAPVIFIDTAGVDDSGELGIKRVEKTMKTIEAIDMAILVIANNAWGSPEETLVKSFKEKEVPFIVVHNKSDVTKPSAELKDSLKERYNLDILEFSTTDRRNIEEFISLIKSTVPERSYINPSLLGDIIGENELVMLVCPIDSEAPSGRLILPQVNMIRDLLDNHAVAIVLQESEIESFMKKSGVTPALVITDSQIFEKVDKIIPPTVPLTGFSVVLARMKGDFDNYLIGTPKISELRDGDRVLILESCSHHVSCDDIGRIKLPHWFTTFTGKKLEFDVVAGLDAIGRPITDYSLVVQCGGCMITKRQLLNRLRPAVEAGVPITNYGMAIAYIHGIYWRAIEPFAGRRDART